MILLWILWTTCVKNKQVTMIRSEVAWGWGTMRNCRVRIRQKLESCRGELKKHDKVKHSLTPCRFPTPHTKERKPNNWTQERDSVFTSRACGEDSGFESKVSSVSQWGEWVQTLTRCPHRTKAEGAVNRKCSSPFPSVGQRSTVRRVGRWKQMETFQKRVAGLRRE